MQAKSFTMEKRIILVYRTDVHHSHESKELIGITTTIRKMKEIVEDSATLRDGVLLDSHQQDLLERIGQTQGYEGQGEFYTETWPLDKLL
jgi:hypothetical protein